MSTKENNKLVSVLMSCYNAEKWLERSIRSILNQSFINWEFVIVDDGSTDNTWNILNLYSKKDERIKIYKKNNTGLADSLNYGLKRCNGFFIARLDSDDFSEPERLKIQYKFLENNPDVILCGSYHYEEITSSKKSAKNAVKKYPTSDMKLRKNLKTVSKFFSHSSAMFKKSNAEKVGGYSKKYKKTQDFDFWLKLSTTGKISCIKKPLVTITKHNQSISNNPNGFNQFIFGIAAATSYFYYLKTNRWLDAVMDDCEWNDFLLQINSVLKKEKFYMIFQSKNKLTFLNITNVKNISLLYYWTKFKLFGTRVPENLSTSILKKRNNHNE